MQDLINTSRIFRFQLHPSSLSKIIFVSKVFLSKIVFVSLQKKHRKSFILYICILNHYQIPCLWNATESFLVCFQSMWLVRAKVSWHHVSALLIGWNLVKVKVSWHHVSALLIRLNLDDHKQAGLTSRIWQLISKQIVTVCNTHSVKERRTENVITANKRASRLELGAVNIHGYSVMCVKHLYVRHPIGGVSTSTMWLTVVQVIFR